MIVGLYLNILLVSMVAATRKDPRIVFNLDKSWRQKTLVHLNNSVDQLIQTSRPLECEADFDDQGWKSVDVPHDFVVEGKFDQNTDIKHGYLPNGFSWYRKKFSLQAFNNKVWRLDFEGCMRRCYVWLNNNVIGQHEDGYVPFRFDVTSSIKTDGTDNVLVVLADSTDPEWSWWYDGGGLYRHVILTALEDIHIQQFGVYAPSIVVSDIIPESNTTAAKADAIVMVNVTLECTVSSTTNKDQMLIVMFRIFAEETSSDPIIVAQGSSSLFSISPSSKVRSVCTNLTLPAANLWSLSFPSLYILETILINSQNGKKLDAEQTTIGIRKLSWDANKGFFLNNVPTKILGTANHQDFAGLGVAIPDTLQAHRLGKIKELGGNAWRTAHNPPNVALLDTADRMGILVWDENHRTGENDNALTLVKRDRNHPSIIIWSICNEILCDSGNGVTSETSLRQAAEIKQIFKINDPYGQRVVSANQNGWIMNNSVLDVLGFDYATDRYDEWQRKFPSYPKISSETSSALSDRGEYNNDKKMGHVTGYDTVHPGWGQTTEKAWGGYSETDSKNNQGILTREFVAGGFTWTGWDYKGEPTPYSWPDINSHFGIYDIAGFDKDRVGWYKSWWGSSHKELFLFPHWNWNVNEDKLQSSTHLNKCKGHCNDGKIEVWVYSNAVEVELFLNGITQGRRKMPRFGHLSWRVPFVAGNITARSYGKFGSKQFDKEVSRVTTGPPAYLRSQIKDGVGLDGVSGDGSDVALVQVDVVDRYGRLVPLPNEHPVVIKFEVVSPRGKLVGTGNGDPSDLTNDKSASRSAYHGSVLGIFQATPTVKKNLRPTAPQEEINIRITSMGFDDIFFCVPINDDIVYDEEDGITYSIL